MRSYLFYILFFSLLCVKTIAAECVSVDCFLEKRDLNKNCFLAMLMEVGLSQQFVRETLGPPASEEIEISEKGMEIKMIWILNHEKKLAVRFHEEKVVHLIPYGFSIPEFFRYKKAVAEFIMLLEPGSKTEPESERSPPVPSNDGKERKEEQEKRFLEEIQRCREWKTIDGVRIQGTFAEIDGNAILIQHLDLPEDNNLIMIEVLRLQPRDKLIVETYCQAHNLKIPELDPLKRIKKGESKKQVLDILGKPHKVNGRQYTWDFGDDSFGPRQIIVSFHNNVVSNVADQATSMQKRSLSQTDMNGTARKISSNPTHPRR